MEEDNKKEEFQELYPVIKTVRFALATDSLTKNSKYTDLVKQFSTPEVKAKIEKYANRTSVSSNIEIWNEQKSLISQELTNLKSIVKEVSSLITYIVSNQNEDKLKLKISFSINGILKSCAFGKSLMKLEQDGKYQKYDFDSGDRNNQIKSTLTINDFDKITNSNNKKNENVKKHFIYHLDAYEEANGNFDLYILFIKKQLLNLENQGEILSKLVQSLNHNKLRIAESYGAFNKVVEMIDLISKIFLESIKFADGLRDDIFQLSKRFNSAIANAEQFIIDARKIIEELHDPKHGYDLGKATLLYQSISKSFIPKITDIEMLKQMLGDKNKNQDLCGHSGLILKAIKSIKEGDNRLSIIEGDGIQTQAEKLIEIVQKSLLEPDRGKVTLWGINNALNNKNQTYDKFMGGEYNFKDLGWKQKLKFGLTVLVDSDVYKNGKFEQKAKHIRSEVWKYINGDLKFTSYCGNSIITKKNKEVTYFGYKAYTEDIYKSINPKTNAKERGNLIINNSRDYKLVNEAVSRIRGGLEVLVRNLQEDLDGANLIEYFAVIAETKGSNKCILLIESDKAGDLYNSIHNAIKVGDETLYKYNSITSKSASKLFNQPYSDSHPFKNFKKSIGVKDTLDKLKFKDLSFEQLKKLFEEGDIAKKEDWKTKFKKFYSKLNSFGCPSELLEDLDKNAFVFESVKFNLSSLKQKFPSLIVCDLEMNTNQKKDSTHHNYFTRAFEKMKKHKDVDIKINPEFQLYYTPQSDEHIKQLKIKEKNVRPFKHNVTKELIDNFSKVEKFCLEEHRYWREYVTCGIPIEIYPKYDKPKSNTTRVIGIDRGEKKIATLCHLEKTAEEEFILPIEYYDENEELRKTFFLDLAYFKVGRVNGNQVIIKWKNDDANLNLKKYEFVTRFVRTIWNGENQEKAKKIFESYGTAESVSKEKLEGIFFTKKQMDDGLKLDDKLFNTHGLGIYLSGAGRILDDQNVLDEITNIIENFKAFDFASIPYTDEEKIDWYINKQNSELKKVKYRDTIAGNIAGIVNFLYKQNQSQEINTYCSLENLYNSSYFGLNTTKIKDVTSQNVLLTDDFVEYSHNKLSQTSIYGKVEQAIMNKLQVYDKENKYLNYSFENKKKNQTKEIQFQLKKLSKEKTEKESYKGKELKYENFSGLHTPLFKVSICFVDPAKTSKRCPKCGSVDFKRNNDKTDSIECIESNCDYDSNNLTVAVIKKTNIDDVHNIIKDGDENGAFFIGLRCLRSSFIKSLPFKK